MTILNKKFVKELQAFQNKFSDYFGVAALIVDNDGNAITQPSGFSNFCKLIRSTPKGFKLCTESKKNLYNKVSDGEPHTYNCAIFSELADALVPIISDDEIVGVWAVGQQRVSDIPIERLYQVADDLGIDDEEFIEAYRKLPITTHEEFNKIVYFLHHTVTTFMKIDAQNERLLEITNISAHDIRENLGMVIGYAELIHRRYGESEMSEYIEYIHEYANKLKVTAEELITLSENN